MAEKKGYIVIYIWEKELRDNKDNLLEFIAQKFIS